MGVNPGSKLVRHPLAQGRDALLFDVAAHAPDDRDEQHHAHGEFENAQGIRPEHRRDRALQPLRQRLGAKHRVEHDLDRPRLEQGGARLGADGGEAKEQDAPVAGQQAKDCGSVCLRIQRRRVVGHPVCLEGVLSIMKKYAPGSVLRIIFASERGVSV